MALPQGWASAPYKSTVIKVSVVNDNKIKQRDYLPSGAYPVIDQGADFIGGYTDDASLLVTTSLPAIVFGDHTKAVKLVQRPFCAGADGIKVVCPPEYLSPKCLYYFMCVLAKKIPDKGYARHYQYLEKETLPIPPLAEQHRIVARIDALFSELDKGVEVLQTVRQQLRTYRQAVLKWAFEGKLTEEWRKTHMFSKEFINEAFMSSAQKECNRINACGIDTEFPIYDIPNDWTWISVGSLSKGIEYGTSAKSEKSGKVVVLRMGNIQNCSLVYDDLAYSNDDAEIEKYMLKKNDVLFNRTNSSELVGKTAIYNSSIPSIFAGYLMRVNQISYINASYLNYYLNSPNARKCGKIAKTDGVNQANINGKKLARYPFPLCSDAEQAEIVSAIESRLSVCDKLEQIIAENLAKAQALRQSILKKAFAGELVLQDPNDEPAEKLLERIKAAKATAAILSTSARRKRK